MEAKELVSEKTIEESIARTNEILEEAFKYIDPERKKLILSGELNSEYYNKLYEKQFNDAVYEYDNYMVPPILYYLTFEDVANAYNIAQKTATYSNKLVMFDKLLGARGFTRISNGTNRAAYFHTTDTRICLKVALDEVGRADGHKELLNQEFLKPYCQKVFDVSYCGTLTLCERVIPISTMQEFEAIFDEMYFIIRWIIGKGLLFDDMGTDSFKNYGIRPGYGTVVLDYPYIMKFDMSKFYCMELEYSNGVIDDFCMGKITYDDGYNELSCSKCHKKYKLIDIANPLTIDDLRKEINPPEMMESAIKRRVQLVRDGKLVYDSKPSSLILQ